MDPAGVFATSFAKDQALIRTRSQAVTLGLFVIALLALPIFSDIRWVAILTSMLIAAVVVVGLQINTGLAGQVNLGQAAFMGVGAYATAVLATKADLPFWLALPMGGLCAAFFGLVFGLTAGRIKGFYLALTTIAAQILFHFLVLNLPAKWLGGSGGIAIAPAQVFGYVVDTDIGIYYLCLTISLVMIAGAYGVARSRHGRVFAAVRDDDVASGMMGINVVRMKVLAFLLGAFYAGIGGGLWAYYVRFVAVDQFTLIHSIWFIAMIIVGGMGSVTGALIGVLVIRISQETITIMGPSLVEKFPFFGGDLVFAVMNIFLGGMIAGFLIFEPRGLMHRWSILKTSYRMWPYPH
jgi:branched-chain amino acid transport system permease protein